MSHDKAVLMEKWAPILDHAGAPKIKDEYRRFCTAILLENQEIALREERQILQEAPHANAAGAMPDSSGVAKYDPVLISLVRRAMPQLMAYDICGVQPMTLPTGLIFAMKSKYNTQGGDEALFNEAISSFSGAATPAQEGTNPVGVADYVAGNGMSTATAEGIGSSGGATFNQMAFSIEKVTVTAKSRALKAEYTQELAQDLKAVHGLDAEQELSNILSTEILAEINREIVRTIYIASKVGAQAGTATAGTFDLDVDSNGRWSVEKFKGLMFQIERDANVIAQTTRRGKGNFIVCSSDVASALAMAGVLDYSSGLSNTLTVDESSSTFAGVLNGKYKVYVDPYAANGGVSPQFALIGYKGSSAYDAGLFYCPYVPLQMVRAIDPDTFQPKIAYKTRYGIVANPFTTQDVTGWTPDSNEGLKAGKNYYYRKFGVTNLM